MGFSNLTSNDTLTITIGETLYNDLNRASREFEAAVTDCYYYIINGGTIEDSNFSRLFNEALDYHYAYSVLKDRVSNEYVVPAIADKYQLNAKEYSIYDSWNIPFDGSHKCIISNISCYKGTDEVVYECDCPEVYVDKVAKLKVRIDIINSIISKLNSVPLSEFAESTAKKLKESRVDMMNKDTINTKDFMDNFVSEKIKEINGDPNELVWTIIVTDKKFTLTKKFTPESTITCTSCTN